jgi:N6-adenosine-specific RNA methylase IME4
MHQNKETVPFGLKGRPPEAIGRNSRNVIIQQRRIGQCIEREALYEIIEAVFPGSMHLEIFAGPQTAARSLEISSTCERKCEGTERDSQGALAILSFLL